MPTSRFGVREERRENEEQRIIRLVELVREFDSQAAFEELKGHLASSIAHFESKYRIPGCDSDEIYQECLCALRYKAIEDFNPERGKFKSFAVLCIKRHLFSLIKGHKQNKRRVLNESLSLDEDRSDNGDNLSLANLITKDALTADETLEKDEVLSVRKGHLLSRLSKLEQEVFQQYIAQNSYEEIVEVLRQTFPDKRRISKKTVDNALVRIRFKAQEIPGEAADFCLK